MSQMTLIILALIGGIFLAMQGGLNAQLGVLLRSPLLASLVAYFFSASIALVAVAISIKSIPTVQQLKEIPYHLWFSGAVFSVIGISLYYYTIPKLGLSTMISLGLFGQLIFSVIAGHFGWFGLPPEPIGNNKIMGVSAMIIGILLINNK